MESATVLLTMVVPMSEYNKRAIVPADNIVQLHPDQSVYGMNPIITSLQEERRRAMGYEISDVPQETRKPKPKKKKVMTYEKAVRRVINLSVENEHMEKKLRKLDAGEKGNVKKIAKLTNRIHDNKQKISTLSQQFNIRPKDIRTESPIRRIGRTFKEGWNSFWGGIGRWIKENAAPVVAIGLTALAIITLVV